MSKFKVGDKVRRINYSNELLVGNVYTISEVDGGNVGVYENPIHCNPTPYDSRNFELVESNAPTKSEADIVKEWFDKLKWLDDNTDIAAFGGFVANEIDEMNDVSCCVDLVINSYTAYKQKAAEANKQKLQSEKEQLLARLSEIDKELGE